MTSNESCSKVGASGRAFKSPNHTQTDTPDPNGVEILKKKQPGSYSLSRNGSSKWTTTLSIPPNWLQSGLKTTKVNVLESHLKALISIF